MSESAFVLEELGVSLLGGKRREVLCLAKRQVSGSKLEERPFRLNKGVGNGNETKGMEPWGRGGNSKAASWMGRGKKTVWQALLFADPAAIPVLLAKNLLGFS